MNDELKNILIAIPDDSYADMLAEIICGLGHIPIISKNRNEAQAYIDSSLPIAAVVADWELAQKYLPGFMEMVDREMPCAGRYILVDMPVEAIIKKRLETNEFCCYMQKPFDLEKFEEGILKCVHEAKITKETCDCQHCLKFKTD